MRLENIRDYLKTYVNCEDLFKQTQCVTLYSTLLSINIESLKL